jgi:hypothetical protein
LLEQLRTVEVSAGPGTPTPHVLNLRRSWPGDDGSLTAEFVDSAVELIGARWFDSLQVAESRLGAIDLPVTRLPSGILVLFPAGRDDHLPALRELLADRVNRLLVHRIGRRAVVTGYASGGAYHKVLPPKKVAGVIRAFQEAAARLEPRVAVPRLIAADPTGVTTWSRIPGECIEHLSGADFLSANRSAGQALAALHASSASDLNHHPAPSEAAVLRRWHDRLRTFDPAHAARIENEVLEATDQLASPSDRAPMPIHRDFHPKQVLIDGGRVGLLDFDMLAAGEPELDVANWLEHLGRRGDGRVPGGEGHGRAAEAFLAGYGRELDGPRLDLYIRASRLRLECVHAFRP